MKGVKSVQSGDIKVGDVVVETSCGYAARVASISNTVEFTYHNGDVYSIDPKWVLDIATNPDEWGSDNDIPD